MDKFRKSKNVCEKLLRSGGDSVRNQVLLLKELRDELPCYHQDSEGDFLGMFLPLVDAGVPVTFRNLKY